MDIKQIICYTFRTYTSISYEPNTGSSKNMINKPKKNICQYHKHYYDSSPYSYSGEMEYARNGVGTYPGDIYKHETLDVPKEITVQKNLYDELPGFWGVGRQIKGL